ncbi:polysaccharide biosynthesis tyrosine autokinase [Polaribacter sp. NJDZ03]|uniref:GumC family protein n=1 Tax=Polaribacter sp. NJDZ03 TaxID=2855841 RepID=UPI001C4A652A|nr:polysaccharide biosynthesis tyrosine autokinase [Polaribacter sp. NJDZ03]
MQTQKENTSFKSNEEGETLNIREELEKYLFHWKWFVLGGIISIIVAFVYLRYSTPQYTASTSILIKDNQKSGISAELEAFKDMGIVGGGSANNTDNEIQILKSRKIIGTVVDTLNLTTLYFQEGRVKRTEVYQNNAIRVIYNTDKESIIKQSKDTSFTVNIVSENKFELKDAEDNFVSAHNFNETISSGIGDFKVIQTESFNFKEEHKIYVTILKRSKVIDAYKVAVNVSAVDKNSSVLNLSLKHPIKEKAEDFLNELVKQYNYDAIKDKSEVSQKTKTFIDERLFAIGKDLNEIQDRVKNFKTDNNITGLSAEGELALQTASLNNEKLINIKTQLNIAEGVLNNLKKQTNTDETLPQNLGFSEGSISESIKAYNELVVFKNRLSVNAGDKNPQIIQYQKEINSLKNNLRNSISNSISSLKTQYAQISNEANKINSKVSAIPLLERGYINIGREQEIISGLYSYLLKKKEETAISLAVTVANAKIIDVAYSDGIPVSPKRKIIFLAALLLGVLVPFIIIYIKNLLDTKIHTRKDIEELTTIPFLGDVPHSETNEKIVIGNDARTSTAEAFRLLRTNLDFMLPTKENDLGKTIFITSTTSGEGKSFISINLAAALSLSNKKVLLMGMDLRAPKVTEYLGIPERKGITNFITNEKVSLEDIKFSIPEIKGLDIIASGVIPPNPAELLLHAKVKELFEEVKKDYDYIIVDTAPVNLVTDTLLVSKYADMFLYVSRANYLDKRMLNVAQTLYNEKKLVNMAIILNDTDMTRGYGYGYGYGYGNAYVETIKKPWYKRILS